LPRKLPMNPSLDGYHLIETGNTMLSMCNKSIAYTL
jgi:hypothetical protein